MEKENIIKQNKAQLEHHQVSSSKAVGFSMEERAPLSREWRTPKVGGLPGHRMKKSQAYNRT